MTQTVPLGDIADIQTGPFGSQLHQEDYVSKGTPIITVEHLGNDRITTQNLPMVSDQDKQRLSKYWIQEGDTIFSRVGSVDRASYVHKEEDGWLFSGRCLRVRPDESKVNPRYLSFVLRSPKFTNYIKSIAVGATMPSINTKLLSTAPVTILPRDIQAKVADILDAIEQKIELNQKMNETLEQIGQVLFRHYFINNPEAKKWENVQISDITTLISRGISPRYDEDGSSLVINQRCIRNGRLSLGNARKQSKPISSDKILKAGDVLINSTGVGTLGRVAQVDKITGNVTADSHVTIVRPNIDSYFFGQMLRGMESVFENMGRGSTGQTELSRTAISMIRVTLPSLDMITRFSSKITPIREQMQENDKETEALTALRDTLLPHLISGGIKI